VERDVLFEIAGAGVVVHELEETDCANLRLKRSVIVPEGGLQIFHCLPVVCLVHKLRNFCVDYIYMVQVLQPTETHVLHYFHIVDQL
jgi:hypothetical protein